MSSTPPTKRLYRSRDKRMISGVCGGLAEYFTIDPTIVRIATVVATIITGVPLIVYIVMMIVVPEEPPKSGEINEI